MHPAGLRAALLRNRRSDLAQKTALHDRSPSPDEIESIQSTRFNTVWGRCLKTSPFYQSWQREHGLPTAIESTEELTTFPRMTRSILVDNAEDVFAGLDRRRAYVTGGSTGEPARYPRGADEATGFWLNTYLARTWSGIQPLDPGVLLWGHAHLFGDGLQARLAQWRRRAADRVLNMTRLDAYDLTDDALDRAYRALIARDPVYLLGYTSAIFRLARHLERNQLPLRPGCRLKSVVVTAETATPADITTISNAFQASVSIEYGTAETGVLAASRGSTWPLRVIWDSFIVLIGDAGTIHVTTLDDRVFPLVNYSPGDVASATEAGSGSTLALQRIGGRMQDIVRVRRSGGGSLELSAILPVHILKSLPTITSVQFKQVSESELIIYLQALEPLDSDRVSTYFARQLMKDHPDFDRTSVKFEQIAEPPRTRSGKHALFVE